MHKITLTENLLSIDIEALNLLQGALFTQPQRELIKKLKDKFGLFQLTPSEVEQELKYVNSPLRKYLIAMMNSLLIRAQILLSENFQEFLRKQLKLQLKRKYRDFLSHLLKRLRRNRLKYALKRKLRIINYLTLKSCHTVLIDDFYHLRPLVVEAHRYDLLKSSLQYSNIHTSYILKEMINSHFQMLTVCFNKYEQITRQKLTKRKSCFLAKWLLSIVNHLKNTSLNNTLPCLKQYLFNVLTKNLLSFRQLQRIAKDFFSEEFSFRTILFSNSRNTKRDNINFPKPKNSFSYELFKKELNEYFTQFFLNDGDILIYETDMLISVANIIQNSTRANHLENAKALYDFISNLDGIHTELREELIELFEMNFEYDYVPSNTPSQAFNQRAFFH
jgi:hypothetical protein